jgi:hypothetical protein
MLRGLRDLEDVLLRSGVDANELAEGPDPAAELFQHHGDRAPI